MEENSDEMVNHLKFYGFYMHCLLKHSLFLKAICSANFFNFGVKIVKNPDFYDFCKLKKLFLKCNTFLAITINTFLHTWLMLLLHFAILHLYIKFTFAKKATLLLLHIFHLRNFVNRSLQFSFSLLAIWVFNS